LYERICERLDVFSWDQDLHDLCCRIKREDFTEQHNAEFDNMIGDKKGRLEERGRRGGEERREER
jgi:hypothetical protein